MRTYVLPRRHQLHHIRQKRLSWLITVRYAHLQEGEDSELAHCIRIADYRVLLHADSAVRVGKQRRLLLPTNRTRDREEGYVQFVARDLSITI